METLPVETPFAPPPPPHKGLSTGAKVAIGCFIGLLVLLCCLVIGGGYAYLERDQIPWLSELIASPTPIPSPTPTRAYPAIIGPQPAAGIDVLHEEFSSNQRDWIPYYGDMSATVEGGKLYIESFNKGYVGLAVCETCESFSGTYYIQATVGLDQSSTVLYGLAFSIGEQGYYIVELNSQAGNFSVYKLVNRAWEPLIQNRNASAIRDYPQTNILGVYFDRGRIEIYINGTQAGVVTDNSPYLSGDFGLYVDDSTVIMSADEVFAYQEP